MPAPTQPAVEKFWGESFPEVSELYRVLRARAVTVNFEISKELVQNTWTGPGDKYANMYSTNPSAALIREWHKAVHYRVWKQRGFDIQKPSDDTKEHTPKTAARRKYEKYHIDVLGWARTDQVFIDTMALYDAVPWKGALPIVELIGEKIVLVVLNDVYNEEGADAYDDSDGVLVVTIAGDVVDTSTLGTYTVTYSATDEGGQTSSISRDVVVSSIEV